jgi:hypothetical protein
MGRWLGRVLSRVHELAEQGEIRFTNKARSELADLGLDVIDACEILCRLTTSECVGRIRSRHTGEWMYVFKPHVSGSDLYLKLLVRGECVIVSFHEEVNAREDPQEE